MGIKLANNAFGTLAAGIASGATSITLTTGHGARFPSLGAGDYFYATLIDTSNNLEIVKCTARSTDVLTVVRAQESTTARAYSAGDRIEIRLTAQTFVDATNIYDKETSSTGYFDIPSGTTAQRPSSPNAGMQRWNTDLGAQEVYNGTVWVQLSSSYQIELLIVGGGGGGSGNSGGTGGGGGGGGFARYTQLPVPVNTSFSVTIGAGGASDTTSNAPSSTFGSLSSSGGYGAPLGGGGAGPSGGNSGQTVFTIVAPFSGGSGGGSANGVGQDARYGGGGAGALNSGGNGYVVNSSNSVGGTGGNGYDFYGTVYGGGGGGGGSSGTTFAAGGTGGGGRGGYGVSSYNGGDRFGVAGTANTGGGGGGGGGYTNVVGGQGANGGSGVVIVRYPGAQRGSGGTVTSSGGYTYHTFTSSGTFTA